ncbi:GNAT family N-acetyltransferase [Georgenia subflava]|uniref:GNAT family N-acetyltransferase n=1 Tax=Georgenia subflava TaxID=1622177 RepID=A0A6N7EIZ9_9MICO|nr:GNAT family N-acetyltransferase [Georgenia subflava]MPV38139.1 GNAT family N-acetyltransferase [Georgenia subflava]
MPTTSPLPAARIRPATVLDAAALAAVHLQGWRETYGAKIPEAVYVDRAEHGTAVWEEMLSDPDAPTTWVAHRDGEPVGLARAEAPGAGNVRPLELRLLYVLAAEQGHGTGHNLVQLAIGDAPCFLWVEEGNVRAQDFYRDLGFELDGATRQTAAQGHLTELRMVR